MAKRFSLNVLMIGGFYCVGLIAALICGQVWVQWSLTLKKRNLYVFTQVPNILVT